MKQEAKSHGITSHPSCSVERKLFPIERPVALEAGQESFADRCPNGRAQRFPSRLRLRTDTPNDDTHHTMPVCFLPHARLRSGLDMSASVTICSDRAVGRYNISYNPPVFSMSASVHPRHCLLVSTRHKSQDILHSSQWHPHFTQRQWRA